MRPDITPEEILTMKTYMTRHVGSSNRVSPGKLAEYMYGKATENNIRKARAVRREINADESNNVIIATDRDEGGFYLASGEDADAVKRHIEEEYSIAMKELEKVRAMKYKAARLLGCEFAKSEGQGRLF